MNPAIADGQCFGTPIINSPAHPAAEGRALGSFPRAGVDPITDPVTAFGVICTAIDLPYQDQVICLLFNHDHTGAGIFVVHDTVDDRTPVEVLELLVDHGNHAGRLGAVAVASVRPGAVGITDEDLNLWQALEEICVEHEVTFLEWWIIGSEVVTPRHALAEPSRWPADR